MHLPNEGTFAALQYECFGLPPHGFAAVRKRADQRMMVPLVASTSLEKRDRMTWKITV